MKIGDIVKLKSGGPKMTVQWIIRSDDQYSNTVEEIDENVSARVGCQWFEGSELKESDFPAESLEGV